MKPDLLKNQLSNPESSFGTLAGPQILLLLCNMCTKFQVPRCVAIYYTYCDTEDVWSDST